MSLLTASRYVFSVNPVFNEAFRNALSVKEIHQRKQISCRCPGLMSMVERDLPCDHNHPVLDLPVSAELTSLMIHKTCLPAVAFSGTLPDIAAQSTAILPGRYILPLTQ